MIAEAFPAAMPLHGLAGGLLIGLSAAILLLGAGRIAGISGIFARMTMLGRSGPNWSASFLFILAMLAGTFFVALTQGEVIARYSGSNMLLILGGLLVGFGTRLGSGCTSGHGVCGISRLSARSLIATATFIISGIVTVAIMNMLEVAV